jgi:hypothetical protein
MDEIPTETDPNTLATDDDSDTERQSPDLSWTEYCGRFFFFDQYPHQHLESPLNVEILAQNQDLEISPADFNMLIDCARWEISPPFYKPGRTAEIPFISVETVRDRRMGSRRIGSYKIKGPGYIDHGIIRPPQAEQEYEPRFAGNRDTPETARKNPRAVLAYMVFGEDGAIKSEVAEAPPKGGVTLEKAKAEYDNAMALSRKPVPAILPIAYGRYPGLSWCGKDMGFVITAVPDTNVFFRAAEYFGEAVWLGSEICANREVLLAALEGRFGQSTEGMRGVTIMKFMQEMNGVFGGSLRKYSEAGLGRYSGHPANYTYDFGIREAILHDFDTSLEIDSLPEKARGLTIVRDVVSALWGIVQATMFSMIHTMTTPEVFLRMNPFEALLRGYFGENKLIREAGRIFTELLSQILKKRPTTMDSVATQNWYVESNTFFVENALGTTMLIFAEDPLNQKYPLPYKGDSRELRTNLERYREERSRITL